VGWGGLEWEQAATAGAVGVQPGCSFIELYLAAQEYLEADDHEGFVRAFSPLRPALTSWMRHPEVLIAVEKHILKERGIIPSSRTRHPSAQLTADDYDYAEQILSLVAVRKR
jgi:4-hydroxy-tetrahydrodipicolinate synthase